MQLPQSPVDVGCLPDDILYTIFCIIVPHRRLGPVTLPIPLEQITLSHVSQHWRAVVLGDPLMWHSILYNTRRKHSLELCQLFLERSQQVALDIQAIVSWTRLEPEESQTFNSLFLPHIRRWRKMDIVCESPQLVSHWSIAPLLESLELRIKGRVIPQEAVNIPFLQGGAPRLKYLHCSSLHGDSRPLDCPSLQELLLEGPYSFSNVSPGDSFHSFTSLVAPQLTRLVAHKVAIKSPFRPPAPVQFDSLVQLELQVRPFTLWEFMERCRFPKLTSVTITFLLSAGYIAPGGSPTPLPTVRNVVIGFDTTQPPHYHNDVATLMILKLTQLFPGTITLKARPFTALEQLILNGAVVGWPKLTSITANTASLDVVKRIVFDRRNHGYFTPLKEFNLRTVQGSCSKEDHKYISQNVDFHVQLAKKPR